MTTSMFGKEYLRTSHVCKLRAVSYTHLDVYKRQGHIRYLYWKVKKPFICNNTSHVTQSSAELTNEELAKFRQDRL